MKKEASLDTLAVRHHALYISDPYALPAEPVIAPYRTGAKPARPDHPNRAKNALFIGEFSCQQGVQVAIMLLSRKVDGT